jgi:hypothetical protein
VYCIRVSLIHNTASASETLRFPFLSIDFHARLRSSFEGSSCVPKRSKQEQKHRKPAEIDEFAGRVLDESDDDIVVGTISIYSVFICFNPVFGHVPLFLEESSDHGLGQLYHHFDAISTAWATLSSV